MDQVRSVTDKPVTMIINTHTHGDHTGSNEFFPASVEVVAQENTKTNMEKMDAFKGEKAQFLPDKTYKDKLTLFPGADRIDLYYFGAGHTNGDSDRRLPDASRAHTRRPVRAQGNAAHRRQQRRQRRALSRNHPKKPRFGIKDVDTVITRAHVDVLAMERRWRVRRVQRRIPRRDEGRYQAPARASRTRSPAFKLPEKFKDYGMNGVKDNVTKIYAELKK